MPYDIKKRGGEWCLVKKSTGKVHQCHPSKKIAEKAIKAIAISEHSTPANRKG